MRRMRYMLLIMLEIIIVWAQRPFVFVFTPLINTETGDFINFPYEGGYMKQPNKLMNLMRIIQMNYKRVRYEKASRVGV